MRHGARTNGVRKDLRNSRQKKDGLNVVPTNDEWRLECNRRRKNITNASNTSSRITRQSQLLNQKLTSCSIL